MKQNLSGPDSKRLRELETQGFMLDAESDVRLIVHIRERMQMIKLASVMLRRADISKPQSVMWLQTLQQDCSSLIGSSDKIDSSFIMSDRSDVNHIDAVFGNEPRNKSLEMINTRYCVEILLIWFQCLFLQKDFKTCSKFLSYVEQ